MTRKIGIIGGLGPLATTHFLNLFFCNYQKFYSPKRDQDFPEISVEFACQTPDRTSYIIGKSKHNPAISMINSLKKLEYLKADLIAIPCNTAHFFFEELEKQKLSETKIIHMIDETAKFCYEAGYKKPLLLATFGTFFSGIYEKSFNKFGIELTAPNEQDKAAIMNLIYNEIKVGKVSFAGLGNITDKYQNDCDVCILGCTELPLISSAIKMPVIDPMIILCNSLIANCGVTKALKR
jgi:aspartate racemase